MKQRTGSLIALAALLAWPLAAVAEPSISSSVDRREVAVGEELVLTVTVVSDASEEGDVHLPATPGFDVLSRSQSSQMQFAFGGGTSIAQKQVTFSLVLSPRREGTLTIGAARVTIGGKTVQSEPIQVKVLPASQARPRPPPPPRPFGGLGPPGFAFEEPQDQRSIFVRVTLDKTRPWLGEQVTMTITLYSRVDISRIEGMTMPRLDGFWAEDIESPTQITGEIRTLDGVPYRAYVLKRRALFPVRAGKLVIDPVEVEVATGFGLFFAGRTAKRQSPRVEVEVLPLPAEGKPAGFDSVNVGEWSLRAEIEPREVGPAQPVTFRLIAEGKGNLRSLHMPKLSAPPGFKAYEPTRDDKVKIERGRYGGRRTMEYLLIPERTGTLAIPAVEMAYFDPVAGKYKVARAEGATVEVRAGAGQPSAGGQVSFAPSGGANVLQSGIKPIRHKSQLALGGLPLYRRPWFAALTALPFLVLAAMFVTERLREVAARGVTQARVRRARARAQRRLRGAQKLLGQGKSAAFCAEVERALMEYVADRAALSARGITRDELRRRLTEQGHAAEAVGALCEALDACDALRFNPLGDEAEARRKVWARAAEAVAQMEEGRR